MLTLSHLYYYDNIVHVCIHLIIVYILNSYSYTVYIYIATSTVYMHIYIYICSDCYICTQLVKCFSIENRNGVSSHHSKITPVSLTQRLVQWRTCHHA